MDGVDIMDSMDGTEGMDGMDDMGGMDGMGGADNVGLGGDRFDTDQCSSVARRCGFSRADITKPSQAVPASFCV